jgi:ribosomal protein L40E
MAPTDESTTHKEHTMPSYEKLIGQALLSGDHDKGMRRVTCKLMASQLMTCPMCGDVLDQKRITVFEVKCNGEVLKTTGVCRKCDTDTLRSEIADKAKQFKLDLYVSTWDETVKLN